MLTFPLAVTERTPPPSIRNKKFRTSDHLTAFSILLDPTPRERISKYHENILEQISYVGSVLSTRTILSPNRIISTPKSILHRKKRKFTNFPISFSQRRGGGGRRRRIGSSRQSARRSQSPGQRRHRQRNDTADHCGQVTNCWTFGGRANNWWLVQHNFPHGLLSFVDGLSTEPLHHKAYYLKLLVTTSD